MTLIFEFINDKKAMFFLNSEKSETQNRAVFKDGTADFTDSDLLCTAQLHLGSIPFKSYHKFFADCSEHRLIEMYAVTEGVPRYIESFLKLDDICQAIEKCIPNGSSRLWMNRFFLQQEVTGISGYIS